MKTKPRKSDQLRQLVVRPILRFDVSAPVLSTSTRLANPLFRMAHFVHFQKSLPFRAN